MKDGDEITERPALQLLKTSLAREAGSSKLHHEGCHCTFGVIVWLVVVCALTIIICHSIFQKVVWLIGRLATMKLLVTT